MGPGNGLVLFTNVDLSSQVFHVIHMKAVSHEVIMSLICNMLITTSPRSQWVHNDDNVQLTCHNYVISLIHTSLGDVAVISIIQFSNKSYRIVAWAVIWKLLSGDCHRTSIINICSGNGLMPSGNKSLPEPMLTQIYVITWQHWVNDIYVTASTEWKLQPKHCLFWESILYSHFQQVSLHVMISLL